MIFHQPKEIRVIDIPRPEKPAPGEAIIRGHRVGVCGTASLDSMDSALNALYIEGADGVRPHIEKMIFCILYGRDGGRSACAVVGIAASVPV
jgi:hypothetical protein